MLANDEKTYFVMQKQRKYFFPNMKILHSAYCSPTMYSHSVFMLLGPPTWHNKKIKRYFDRIFLLTDEIGALDTKDTKVSEVTVISL